MNEVVLEVKELITKFKTQSSVVTAVNDVSFKINKGKILGIVGESGCGKSVTSLSIMRLIDKRSGMISNGSILYNNQDLLKLSEKDMQKFRGNDIAMIFQEPMTALNPVFTVGFQMGEVLELHQKIKGKENIDKCIQLLKRVGISRPEKVIKEYPHQLSGGMRQRVMIAMALLCNPKLLIADEPTTALDVTIQAQVLELMKGLLNDYQMSILFITHDLGVIAEMANDIIVMYGGKIVEQGSVKEIFNIPMHPYTKGLMASRPSIGLRGQKLTCIGGMVPSLENMPKGCTFEPRCSKSSDICKTKMPELIELENEHKVRCWHANKEAGVS